MAAVGLCLASGCSPELVTTDGVAEIQSEAREPDGIRESFEDYAPGSSISDYYGGVGGAGACSVTNEDAGQAQQSYKLDTGSGAAGVNHFASAKLCISNAAAPTTKFTGSFRIKLDNLQPWTLFGISNATAYLAWWWIDGTGAVYEGSGGVITTLAAATWHDVRIEADTVADTLTFSVGTTFTRTVTMSTAWTPRPGAVIDCLRLRTSYTGQQVVRLDHFRSMNK